MFLQTFSVNISVDGMPGMASAHDVFHRLKVDYGLLRSTSPVELSWNVLTALCKPESDLGWESKIFVNPLRIFEDPTRGLWVAWWVPTGALL